MDRARFETLTQEIAAQATVEQLLDLETRTARLLAERVSEALVARRTTAVRQCPHCSGTKIVRHGRDGGGRQRFRCLKTDESHGCGRTFNGLSGTAFARMRKPELWSGYARHLASGTSLTKIVECSDMAISRHTAWRWRHRLLTPLAATKPERLGGVVEADETFFLRSFKGHRGWKRGKAPENRPPRYPGSKALLSGLSHQHVPVLTGIDRDGRCIDKRMDRRSTDQIVAALGGAVAPDSVLCTDGLSAYATLAKTVGAEHRVFDPPEDDWLKKAMGHPSRQKGALGLGRVNGHHERMKTLINRVLRGVSTKFLPNYLAMLRLVCRPPSAPQDTLQAAFAAG
ncbi:transposase-like protein [Rhodoblastus acidophilus]|uniref:IS1595 family transposase n=1 Tax=Rhodoblastus acidophilus TaxID=1074 RepID=UPI002224F964|nr:IS1595 family transposase [Rhodoblastus acidophilus]MCW2282594.1 transposase-like protein [Rhodoblastus acidophilus]MCW2331455.1 transposase-like protein [Rhodoblastus acidophilus]